MSVSLFRRPRLRHIFKTYQVTQAEVAALAYCGTAGVGKFLQDRRGDALWNLAKFCEQVRVAKRGEEGAMRSMASFGDADRRGPQQGNAEQGDAAVTAARAPPNRENFA